MDPANHGYNLAMLIAVLLSPFLAVQAQKAIESFREKRGRKLQVFYDLMFTRATRISWAHVRALNAIDLAFYGSKFFGRRWQSRSERDVVEAWRAYLAHLTTDVGSGEAAARWGERSHDLFIELLFAISEDLGFHFDKTHLKTSWYSPKAHESKEDEENEIRSRLLSIFRGEASIKMDVMSLPLNADALRSQIELQTEMGKVFRGERVLSIEMTDPKGDREQGA